MIFTKTREGAKVPSRNSSYLEFNTSNYNLVQGNKQPIGSVTLSQTDKGIWYPNIQSAIDDVSSMIANDLGEVIVNTTGELPGPQQQITRATFSGVIALTSTNVDTVIEILGIPISVENGDDAAAVATKWVNKLNDYVANNTIIDLVNQNPATPNIVDIKHIDYQTHVFDMYKFNGITVSFSINSPAKSGFGTWYKIGQEDKTFGTEKYTLHYFRRIG